jgi:hypothetical protein
LVNSKFSPACFVRDLENQGGSSYYVASCCSGCQSPDGISPLACFNCIPNISPIHIYYAKECLVTAKAHAAVAGEVIGGVIGGSLALGAAWYGYRKRENCIQSMRSMREAIGQFCLLGPQPESPRQPQEPDIEGNSSRIGPSMPSERSGFRDNGIEQPVQPIEHPVQTENQDTVDNLMSEYEESNRRKSRFVRDPYNNIREILRESPSKNDSLRRVRNLYRNKMNAALNIGITREQFDQDFRIYVERIAEHYKVPYNLRLKFSSNIRTITKLVTNLEGILYRHDDEDVLLIHVRELYTNTLRNSATSGMSRQELAQEFRYCVEKLMNDRDILENTRARVMEYDRIG